MRDMITLACPSCGGNLRVTEEIDRFACPYCSREHLVERSSGHVTLVPMVKQLDRIGTGVDRQSSEMAIRRLREDKRIVKRRIEEWSDELAFARARYKAKRGNAILQTVIAVCSAIPGVALCAMDDKSIPCGVLLLFTAFFCGLAGLVNFTHLPRFDRRVAIAKQKLDKFYHRLDDLDAEYDVHMRIVRRT